MDEAFDGIAINAEWIINYIDKFGIDVQNLYELGVRMDRGEPFDAELAGKKRAYHCPVRNEYDGTASLDRELLMRKLVQFFDERKAKDGVRVLPAEDPTKLGVQEIMSRIRAAKLSNPDDRSRFGVLDHGTTHNPNNPLPTARAHQYDRAPLPVPWEANIPFLLPPLPLVAPATAGASAMPATPVNAEPMAASQGQKRSHESEGGEEIALSTTENGKSFPISIVHVQDHANMFAGGDDLGEMDSTGASKRARVSTDVTTEAPRTLRSRTPAGAYGSRTPLGAFARSVPTANPTGSITNGVTQTSITSNNLSTTSTVRRTFGALPLPSGAAPNVSVSTPASTPLGNGISSWRQTNWPAGLSRLPPNAPTFASTPATNGSGSWGDPRRTMAPPARPIKTNWPAGLSRVPSNIPTATPTPANNRADSAPNQTIRPITSQAPSFLAGDELRRDDESLVDDTEGEVGVLISAASPEIAHASSSGGAKQPPPEQAAKKFDE